jgi:hypothetical protein
LLIVLPSEGFVTLNNPEREILGNNKGEVTEKFAESFLLPPAKLANVTKPEEGSSDRQSRTDACFIAARPHNITQQMRQIPIRSRRQLSQMF